MVKTTNFVSNNLGSLLSSVPYGSERGASAPVLDEARKQLPGPSKPAQTATSMRECF